MSHDHGHTDRSSKNMKRLAIVLAFTSVYMIAEVVGGIATGSLALLADAGHMLTDVGGLALALVAMKFAAKPASPEKTYGYYRVEILAALTNAVVLIGISIYILVEAYQRFRHPPEVQSKSMIVVAAIGLVVNLAGVNVLKAGSEESLNMKGAYFEVISDLLTSIGVIVAGVIMLATGWYLADPILSAGIGLFIFPRTWKLMKEAVGVLLEGTPSDVNLTALRQSMGEVPGVAGVHDLHVWALTSNVNAMSAHVVVAAGAAYEDVLAAVNEHVRTSFKIGHVTIQVEPKACSVGKVHV
ncbi:MAG: cation diffusion facilitator family transporter [Polyangiaceae bacterium]